MKLNTTKYKGEVRIIVKDENGKVIKKHKQSLRSFLKNFDHLLALSFASTLYLSSPIITLYDIDGNARDVYGVKFFTGDITRLCLGSGTTPVSPDDYTMASFIIRYKVSVFSYDPSTRTIKIRGSIVNDTTNTWNVNEVGVIISSTIFIDSAGNYSTYPFLVIRDVLDSTVVVEPGQSITVEFTITVTVSG